MTDKWYWVGIVNHKHVMELQTAFSSSSACHSFVISHREFCCVYDGEIRYAIFRSDPGLEPDTEVAPRFYTLNYHTLERKYHGKGWCIDHEETI